MQSNFGINKNINQTGTINTFDISETQRLRVVLEGDAEISIYAQIIGQTGWSDIGTITADDEGVYTVDGYERMRIDVDILTDPTVKVIAQGYNDGE